MREQEDGKRGGRGGGLKGGGEGEGKEGGRGGKRGRGKQLIRLGGGGKYISLLRFAR